MFGGESPFLEVVTGPPQHPIRHALFDFDGTLSLIREGWQQVMIPFFVEEILAAGTSETPAEVETAVREFVDTLTGKQTIYQCLKLREEVLARGGSPSEALEYKYEYLRRLNELIKDRVTGLANGTVSPEAHLLPGSRDFLQGLVDRGIDVYLASGTDIAYVRAESEALQVAHFFGPHIYGALDHYQNFSKQMIIDQILCDNHLSGPELVIIGDGYVEILNGKGVGAYTLGVASWEAAPGPIDAWKRDRLISAGADAIVPDFRRTDELLAFLLGG